MDSVYPVTEAFNSLTVCGGSSIFNESEIALFRSIVILVIVIVILVTVIVFLYGSFRIFERYSLRRNSVPNEVQIY